METETVGMLIGITFASVVLVGVVYALFSNMIGWKSRYEQETKLCKRKRAAEKKKQSSPV